MFFLIISGTELSKTPGLSAAGANPDIIPLTSPADSDVIQYGRPRAIDTFPLDPQGHPTPAIITRAAILEADIPVTTLRAGSYLPPAAPYVELGAEYGKNPCFEPAVPDAENVFEAARMFAAKISPSLDCAMLAETIPGGTTTALLVLRALGYDGMVSSGGIDNPTSLKEEIWAKASARAGIRPGDLRNEPLRAVRELGDPMQAAALGFLMGLPENVPATLAGGTQMLAVAALLRAMAPDKRPEIATTKYVVNDRTSSFNDLAKALDLQPYVAQLDFSASPFPGLSDYEKGYVKEGVGAGGSVLYAERRGVPVERVVARTNALYAELPEIMKK